MFYLSTANTNLDSMLWEDGDNFKQIKQNEKQGTSYEMDFMLLMQNLYVSLNARKAQKA